MDLRPVGDTALLVDLDGLDAVLGWVAALGVHPLPGVVDVVPGARTVLVRWEPGSTTSAAVAAGVRERASEVEPVGARDGGAGEVVEVPVTYDGPDLDDVARQCGLSPAEVVTAHTGAAWVVAFCGFAPGFGYLTGGDERLHVPRRDSPRTRVPAGAVALAGEWSAVYPRESPGGWQLVGRTDLRVWRTDRDPPALLRPGVHVRFRAVGGA